jgi:GNAT superfamily N-acetyltransferase
MLADGLHAVPAGKLATVVTYLEMTAPAEPPAAPLPEGLTFAPEPDPSTAAYRDLFTRIGARDWLWFSRLLMPERELAAILADPGTALFLLRREGHACGMLELDFRVPGACELAFFGVEADLTGRGAGRFLMAEALRRAWARPIRRLHVHTCTLDSPRALGFYRNSGFRPVRQAVEIVDDPRLSGAMPESFGPHIPIFRA